jgi:hypothetical protein
MRYNSIGTIKILSLIITFSLALIYSSLYISGCADNPTSLGKNFLPPNDTTGVKVFDSYTDTMQFTSRNIRKYVNTSASPNLIVGQSGNYNSKALIKFYNLSQSYDSAVVNSAVLQLKYDNYYFPTAHSDSLGNISFDIYTVERDVNYGTVTVDSINSTLFGTVSQGNYTGSPVDTQTLNINLNSLLVQNWLSYAADTSHGVHNYGIVLYPNTSSAVLKAFYSGVTAPGLRPLLRIILTKGGQTDTITTDETQTVSLVTTSFNPDPGIFRLQGGVSYIQTLRFTQNKIPPTATINDAQVILTLDSADSKFSTQTAYQIIAYYISDTSNGITTETGLYYGNPSGNQYTIRIIQPFQRWVQGQTNWGIEIVPYNQTYNLDLFTFYDINAADHSKRPRVIIKYTPRVSK